MIWRPGNMNFFWRRGPAGKNACDFLRSSGTCAWRLEDYSRAIAAYDDALHDDPKDWEANLARARAFSAIDLNQRAIESYLRCIKLKPTEAAPVRRIGAGV